MKGRILTSIIAGAALVAGVTAFVAYAGDAGQNVRTASASADEAVPGGPSRFISQDDFIRASEQTVNGVVSVKSFASVGGRQHQQKNAHKVGPFLLQSIKKEAAQKALHRLF